MTNHTIFRRPIRFRPDRSVILCFAILLLILAAASSGAAPPVQGTEFSAVTRNPYATRAAFAVLERGGTAADAAFSAAAVLSVVEGWFSNVLGGGTWALYYDAGADEVTALDAVGPTGSGAYLERFLHPTFPDPGFGMHLANVPGAWSGWMSWLGRYGTMELPELLSPAVELAEEGFPASRIMVAFITEERERILRQPETRAIFMPESRVPAVGDIIVQKQLAATFRGIIAAYRKARWKGRAEAIEAANRHVYCGPVAKALVSFSKSRGGHLELPDFWNYRAEYREPLTLDYRGITVFQNPPNSQGITMLMALNILEGFNFSGLEQHDPEAIHLIAEATKLAHVDKHFYVADPAFADIPVDLLLSDAYAARQRGRIRPDRALSWPIAGGLADTATYHTTTFQIVDRWGNGAAVTTSIGAQFLAVGDTGILINQRVANMELDPGNPNAIAPRKKVRHTSNPYMAFRNGRLYILGGNTGFDTQPQGQIQQFLNVVEFGMDPQEAVSRPRFITHSFPASTYPHRIRDQLVLERGFPSWVVAALRKKGHSLGRYAIFGNANMTVIDPETRVISLGADPRGENLGMAK